MFIDMILYTFPMPTPAQLLKEMARIDRMERGTLCRMREGRDGPYFNHQTWENGRNVVRYVPREQVAALLDAHPDEVVFRYDLEVDGEITEEQRNRLFQASSACPVRKTLSKCIRFERGAGA